MPKKTNQPPHIAPDLEGAPADPAGSVAHSNGFPSYEEVSRLAYDYWQARGCPDGSSEEDWLRAEHDLKNAASS